MYTNTILALFTAGLAAVNAYTKPVGAEPKGNPISQPGLASIVPVGENFTITWDPTTDGTVSLILLKGPATDLKLVYPIVEKIENSGSYIWLPKDDLAPSDTGYGIQLIVDSNGQYQYTTQFGISNPDYKAAPSGYGYGAAVTSSSASASASHSASATITSAYPIKANTTLTGTAPLGTGASSYPAGNSSLVRPTGSLTVPASLRTSATLATYSSVSASASASAASATSAAASQPSSGASNMAASIGGLAIAAGVALFAL